MYATPRNHYSSSILCPPSRNSLRCPSKCKAYLKDIHFRIVHRVYRRRKAHFVYPTPLNLIFTLDKHCVHLLLPLNVSSYLIATNDHRLKKNRIGFHASRNPISAQRWRQRRYSPSSAATSRRHPICGSFDEEALTGEALSSSYCYICPRGSDRAVRG